MHVLLYLCTAQRRQVLRYGKLNKTLLFFCKPARFSRAFFMACMPQDFRGHHEEQ
jgi:hypothetical protein